MHGRTRALRRPGVVAVALVTLLGACVAGAPRHDAAAADPVVTRPSVQHLWTVTPDSVTWQQADGPVVVGTRFRPEAAGQVDQLRVLQDAEHARAGVLRLWDASGRSLARVRVRPDARAGWRTVRLTTPVPVRRRHLYTVSWTSASGLYPSVDPGVVPVPGDAVRVSRPVGARADGTGVAPEATETEVFPVDVGFRPYGDRPGWEVTRRTTGLAGAGLRCEDLPLYRGPSVVPPGTRITRRRVTTPLVLSGDVLVEESCIQPTKAWQGLAVLSTTNHDTGRIARRPVTVRDSEIDGSRLSRKDAAWMTGFTGVANLQRNHWHHLGSGVAFVNTGARLSALVEGNLVDDLVAWGSPETDGNHSDAFTVRDFTGAKDRSRLLLVRGNRFVCDSANSTGAAFVQTWAGDIRGVTFERNLFAGRGYQLGLETSNGHGYRRMRAVDNRFSGTSLGPAYVGGGKGWRVWKGNHINRPARPAHRGKRVPAP